LADLWLVLAHKRVLFEYISKLLKQDIPDPIMSRLFPRLFLPSISHILAKIEEYYVREVHH
jgi:hypothetical protein